jgi:LmbE family N-acetylglucosaminyl deacetylase
MLNVHIPIQNTYLLSPHCDDAALSVGAWLGMREIVNPITIITLFSESTFAVGVRGGRRRVSAIRKSEDRAFARSVNADIIFLGFPDAPLRPQFRKVPPETVFDPATVIDHVLAGHIANRIQGFIHQNPRPLVIAPIGIGSHIDHRTTCAVARLLDSQVAFYADQPYALRSGSSGMAGASLLASVSLTPEVRELKRRQLSLYESQPEARNATELLNRLVDGSEVEAIYQLLANGLQLASTHHDCVAANGRRKAEGNAVDSGHCYILRVCLRHSRRPAFACQTVCGRG